MKLFILSILLFLICCPAELLHGQGRHFKSGYYVNLQKDTVQGYTSITTIDENVFFYKPTAKGKKFNSIPFDSCRFISRKDDRYYIVTVNRSLEYLDKFTYEIMMQGLFQSSALPLKLLFTGKKFALFQYKGEREHYFLYDGETMTELAISYSYPTDGDLMKLNLTVKSRYNINKDYQRQIITLFNDELTQQQKARVLDTEYEEKPLISLFSTLDKPGNQKDQLKINLETFNGLNK